MSELEKIVIGKESLPALILTILFMIIIPIVFFIYWRKKHKDQTKMSYLIAGMIGFLISARVLELGVHYVCLISKNPISHFLNTNTWAYALYGIVMAGIFEECGRYVIFKSIMKKHRTRENVVLYGIGHGGMEIFTVILPAMITYLVIVVLFSSGNIQNALKTLKMTKDNIFVILPAIKAAATFTFITMVLSIIERLLTMFIQIGLTVIVYVDVINTNKVKLLLAIVLHMLVDLFPVLYQRKVLSLGIAEIWLACWCIIIIFMALRLYRNENRIDA